MVFSRRSGRCLWLGAAAAAILWTAPGSHAQSTATPQKTMLVEPPAPLLPATLDKLSRVAEGDIGDGLGAVDPAQASVLKEDGLRRFAQSDYTPSQNKDAHPHANIAVY